MYFPKGNKRCAWKVPIGIRRSGWMQSCHFRFCSRIGTVNFKKGKMNTRSVFLWYPEKLTVMRLSGLRVFQWTRWCWPKKSPAQIFALVFSSKYGGLRPSRSDNSRRTAAATAAVPPGRPPRPRRPPIYSPVERPRSRRAAAAAAASPRCCSRARALPSLHRRRRRRVLRRIRRPLLRDRFARRGRKRGNDGRYCADLWSARVVGTVVGVPSSCRLGAVRFDSSDILRTLVDFTGLPRNSGVNARGPWTAETRGKTPRDRWRTRRRTKRWK